MKHTKCRIYQARTPRFELLQVVVDHDLDMRIRSSLVQRNGQVSTVRIESEEDAKGMHFKIKRFQANMGSWRWSCGGRLGRFID
jgi:hypothetical protein